MSIENKKQIEKRNNELSFYICGQGMGSIIFKSICKIITFNVVVLYSEKLILLAVLISFNYITWLIKIF